MLILQCVEQASYPCMAYLGFLLLALLGCFIFCFCSIFSAGKHWAAGGKPGCLQSWTWRLATISLRVSSITALEDFSHDQYTSLSLMNIEYRSLELTFISSKFRISSSFSFDVSEKAEHETALRNQHQSRNDEPTHVCIDMYSIPIYQYKSYNHALHILQ